MSVIEELTRLITEKGEEIRKLKAEKAVKEAIAQAVAELLTLKEK
jgi:hypothetical protein